MNLGRIVEVAPAETLFATPRHPYTRALLSAIPVPKPRAKRDRMLLQGDLPSAIDPPTGCRFHTRCPHAIELCRKASPELVTDFGHATACHRWHELIAVATPIPSEARSAKLERLIARFARPRDVQPASSVGTLEAGDEAGQPAQQ
jgi:peptide/nickel transport system ATP-binding protein/oligopeptide transport system ATP-binding protein